MKGYFICVQYLLGIFLGMLQFFGQCFCGKWNVLNSLLSSGRWIVKFMLIVFFFSLWCQWWKCGVVIQWLRWGKLFCKLVCSSEDQIQMKVIQVCIMLGLNFRVNSGSEVMLCSRMILMKCICVLVSQFIVLVEWCIVWKFQRNGIVWNSWWYQYWNKFESMIMIRNCMIIGSEVIYRRKFVYELVCVLIQVCGVSVRNVKVCIIIELMRQQNKFLCYLMWNRCCVL